LNWHNNNNVAVVVAVVVVVGVALGGRERVQPVLVGTMTMVVGAP
jgi:hypothetical protein